MVLPQSRAQTYAMMTFQDLAVRSHALDSQLWLESFR